MKRDDGSYLTPEARARRQIAAEIVEDLEAALAQFAEIAKSLGGAPDMEEGEASR